MTRKLDEIRSDLNIQIFKVINSAIAEKALPSIQNVLGVQNLGSDTIRDPQSGRLNRSPEDYFSHMNHQSSGLNEGLTDHPNSMDHWSKGLNIKGRRNQSGHTTHQSRQLDRGLRVYPGQTDHQSNRLDENPGDRYGQVDCRSTGPDRGSKCCSGVSAHRSTRPDNDSGEHFGPQDQQNNIKKNPKFSSHRGLNREISIDCDN